MVSLVKDEYEQYGRQLILPEIGMQGQIKLKSSAVLIVGVGGLGCPAATYLAGAGVGKIGLIDGDKVELSNLHRQILHTRNTMNMNKVDSAIQTLRAINPNIQYFPYRSHVSTENILSIVEEYDIVLDCTDHPTSRYLISDACVLRKKPLISASALRTEGQLMVLNSPPLSIGHAEGGPCYRCIFPNPPPPVSVISCGEGGILGPVVGTMGVLQALEAIKSLISQNNSKSLLLFSAFSSPPFRSIKLRGRKKSCQSCSAEATINERSFEIGSIDYVRFCGLFPVEDILSPEERISASAFSHLSQEEKASSLLIDIREAPQFDICKVDQSINIPWSTLSTWTHRNDVPPLLESQKHIYFICRFGNDSQLAVRKFKELGLDSEHLDIQDISGGLQAWREQVDHDFPIY